MSQAVAPPLAPLPSAPASGPLAASINARLAPLIDGLGLTEAELLDLGIDLLEELLDDDPELLRARVADIKAARSSG